MGPSGRSWLRRLVKSAAVLVVLAGCLAAAAKYWFVPRFLRRELHEGLGKVWDGTVEVGRVEFNFFGPLRLERVVLRDWRSGPGWKPRTCR